jgi:type II secretory pathway pseudopilin PulG
VKCRRHACGGFTYLGLLMLIAMMGLALTVVSDVWQTAQQRDKEEQLLFAGDQIRRAIGRYFASNGSYPLQLEDLLKDPRFPGVRRFLRRLYRDPITGSAEWGLVKLQGDAISGVYSLSEQEPLKKAEFSMADQSFEGKMKYSEWVFFPRIGLRAGAVTPGTRAAARAQPDPTQLTQPQPGTTPPQLGTKPRRFGSPQL